MKIDNILNSIVTTGVLHGYSCLLLKHDEGYAFLYKGEVKNIGNVTEEYAIQRFNNWFGFK